MSFQSSFAHHKPLIIKNNNPYYCAVRHNADGANYLDTSTLRGALDEVQRCVTRDDAAYPRIASTTPVVAIVRVTLAVGDEAQGKCCTEDRSSPREK